MSKSVNANLSKFEPQTAGLQKNRNSFLNSEVRDHNVPLTARQSKRLHENQQGSPMMIETTSDLNENFLRTFDGPK